LLNPSKQSFNDLKGNGSGKETFYCNVYKSIQKKKKEKEVRLIITLLELELKLYVGYNKPMKLHFALR